MVANENRFGIRSNGPRRIFLGQGLSRSFDLKSFLIEIKPDFIYYVAAFHGPSGMDYEENFEESYKINVVRPFECLKYCKEFVNTKFIFFNSSKVYDTRVNTVISEKTFRTPNCIYSLQKELVFKLMDNYRNKYGVNSYNFWFFNHESERRKLAYFFPKLISIFVNSYRDSNYTGEIAALEFVCDWGDAEQYMEIVAKLSLETDADDYVVASGESLTGRMLAETLFLSAGLDFKNHIRTLSTDKNQTEKLWRADNSKLLSKLPGLKMNLAIDTCKKILIDNYNIKL